MGGPGTRKKITEYQAPHMVSCMPIKSDGLEA